MRRIHFFSASVPLRVALALAAFAAAANARAAVDPPQPEPDAAAAQAAREAPPPIPYAHGAAPQDFPADPRKITSETLPNGTRVYHMNGQGMESIEAHVGADGRLTYRCTDRIERTTGADPAANAAAENAHEQ